MHKPFELHDSHTFAYLKEASDLIIALQVPSSAHKFRVQRTEDTNYGSITQKSYRGKNIKLHTSANYSVRRKTGFEGYLLNNIVPKDICHQFRSMWKNFFKHQFLLINTTIFQLLLYKATPMLINTGVICILNYFHHSG